MGDRAREFPWSDLIGSGRKMAQESDRQNPGMSENAR